MAPRKKLGELLLEEGLIDEIQLRSAIGHQKNWGGKLGSTLVELGFLREEDIARVLEEQLHQRCLSEKDLKPQMDALKLMNMQDALRLMVLPLKLEGNVLIIAMTNPFDLARTDELGFKLGKTIKGVMVVESAIKNSIKKFYGDGRLGRDYKVDLKATQGADTPEIVQEPERHKETKANGKVEPSPELIAKALAYLLIEKGIIKRDELIDKMKALKEKGMG